MDKVPESWFIIPLADSFNDRPIYVQNLINHCEDHAIGPCSKMVTEIVVASGGRFRLCNTEELEPLGEHNNNVDAIVFENTEDATCFILKWS